eukprot:CAMPEP_0195283202 /NCGR_PEP_ID=MMETSP0707-20130614/1828_1 /TAXON_ID=33640 /ORGANISM="Asterionellopsis glacialis, Strain CCMP134" /LENGTH=586 /DNA_ID=CAMNT_0040342333 /DNA_START=64 /DNA_END=1824 /DNA_ORIENTATION=+
MVQMTAADQAIVKALPGNNKCADCSQKNPQWASVSFGTVFCLECSGVHRSLGVHISFVRSIAMDSWTDKQLALMKGGGNEKCADYLKAKGIAPGTAIKEKYENPAAQLYKEVLKARVEGRPEPTTLPTPAQRNNNSANRAMSSVSSASSMGGGGAAGKPGEDRNGMERLTGETDEQYIQRQARLKEEARARMQAKFGRSGGLGNSSMGGVGSSGPYQGIGSNPHGGGGYGPGVDMDSVVAGLGSALGSLGSMAGSAVNTVSTSVSSVVQDESTRQSVANLAGSIKTTGGSFWSSLSTSVSTVAQSVTALDQGDGLSELQQQFHSQRSASGSKYEGFGSNNKSGSKNEGGFDFNSFGSAPAPAASSAPSSAFSSGGVAGVPSGEASGLPGEDRNGVAALTGESDTQYMARQQRLRDEAKARMAAKFGSAGLGSSSSGPAPTPAAAASVTAPSHNEPVGEAPGLPGEDRNGIAALTGESDAQYMARQQRIRDEAKVRMAAKFGNGGLSSVSSAGGMTASSTSSLLQSTPGSRNSSAPSSGNFGAAPAMPNSAPASGNRAKLAIPQRQKLNATKVKMEDSGDFFSNFGA